MSDEPLEPEPAADPEPTPAAELESRRLAVAILDLGLPHELAATFIRDGWTLEQCHDWIRNQTPPLPVTPRNHHAR